jgi:hypothetical protein
MIIFGMGKKTKFVRWRPIVVRFALMARLFYTDLADIFLRCQWGEGRRRLLASEKHRRLYMDNDRPLSMAPYIGELLDAGIPLLVYNGDRDMTTNMVGSEMVLNTRLEWHGKGEWQDAPRGMWKTDYMTKNEYTGGWAKELGGLTFVVVYNSDHASPVVGSFSRSRRHTRTYNAGNNIGM